MHRLFFDRVETPLGVFSVVFHPGAIWAVYFPGQAPPECPQRSLPWPDLARDLRRYFEGHRLCRDKYPLDCSAYASFTNKLLAAVSRIPYGEVRSYRQMAESAGSPLAWRAAGQALAANRHPLLVPCHRVVRSDGSPGGFSGPAGWKKMLLDLEAGRCNGVPGNPGEQRGANRAGREAFFLAAEVRRSCAT